MIYDSLTILGEFLKQLPAAKKRCQKPLQK